MNEQDWGGAVRTKSGTLACGCVPDARVDGEADDAIQETWLRLGRSDASSIDNLGGWLTTVVARVCLDMLRSRTSRREESLDTEVVEPPAKGATRLDPEQEAVLADSVGLALLVVLDRLSPAERLTFVLHDLFAVPFDEIARISVARRQRPASSRVARDAACRAGNACRTQSCTTKRCRRKIFDRVARWRLEGLVAVLDPEVSSTSTKQRQRRALHAKSAAQPPGQGTQSRSRAARASSVRCWSTERWAHARAAGTPVARVALNDQGRKIAQVDIIGDPVACRNWSCCGGKASGSRLSGNHAPIFSVQPSNARQEPPHTASDVAPCGRARVSQARAANRT